MLDSRGEGALVANRPGLQSIRVELIPTSLETRVNWPKDPVFVEGISPGPGGNFIEGRTALTLGLGFDRQNKLQFDLSYTTFSGGGRYNLISDRDFVGTNIKYSF